MRIIKGYARDREGIVYPKDEYVHLSNKYVMMYQSRSLSKIMFRLEKASMHLFAYLIETHSGEGEFNVNTVFTQRFREHLEIMDHKQYVDRTIRAAVKDLLENELILKIGRGTYILNPIHIYKGDSNLREEKIRETYIKAAQYKDKDELDQNKCTSTNQAHKDSQTVVNDQSPTE